MIANSNENSYTGVVLQGSFGHEWSEPEPLPDNLQDVPKMDIELFPAPFAKWLLDISERMQCPVEFVAIPSIIGVASIVGNQIGIRPKQYDDWLEIPNLFGAIVGRPGVKKSPAMKEALKPIYSLIEIANQTNEPSKPTKRRYVVNNTTIEMLGVLLNQNPRGLLLFRDELTGWLREFERKGHEVDRQFYLEAWNGQGSFSYDRIGRGSLVIENVTLSILGGIQPYPVTEHVHAALNGGRSDDGLLQRFQLLVYPNELKEWRNVDREPDYEAQDRVFKIFKVLDNLDPEAIGATSKRSKIPYLRFNDDAQQFFNEWLTNLENSLLKGRFAHQAIEAHYSKYRKLMPSLALLFHLIEFADDSHEGDAISLADAIKAAAWCDFLFEHAQRVYSLGSTQTNSAKTLLDHIEAGDLKDLFTVRDVQQKCWSGLTTTKDVDKSLDVLKQCGWIRAVEPEPNPKGGRPTTRFLINPKVKK